MVSWSTKRQFLYIGGAIIVFLFALALPTFIVVYKAPSCTDNKLNQGEEGIDCGGPCTLLCKASALDMIVHWQRSFKVKAGVYNALAYVENPNRESGVTSINYHFEFYDNNNVLIYERRGRTFIPPKKIFGIFESNITTGTRIPVTTFFEFSEEPLWRKDYQQEGSISMTNEVLSDDNGLPRLSAVLENRGNESVSNIEVVAVVYDASRNAVGVSRTMVDSVAKGGTSQLNFTWPEAFVSPATRLELLYRILR